MDSVGRTGAYDGSMESTRRRYGQHCGLAHALDVVGERWTLLVVRELSTGPKRYTDLLGALTGIGTNLLARRLQDLEAAGIVVRRTLAPPAASAVYQLTGVGAELGEALVPLRSWGLRHFTGPFDPAEDFRVEWALAPAVRNLDPAAAGDPGDRYEFRVGESVAHVRVRSDRVSAHVGPAETPSVVLRTDAATFVDVGTGRIDPAAAVADGRMHIDGDAAAVGRFLRFARTLIELAQADAK